MEEVQYKNVTFNVWDIGGQNQKRHILIHNYKGFNSVIFVIDSTDHERIYHAN